MQEIQQMEQKWNFSHVDKSYLKSLRLYYEGNLCAALQQLSVVTDSNHIKAKLMKSRLHQQFLTKSSGNISSLIHLIAQNCGL